MDYHSLKNVALKASFSEALLSSLAPDGGLYMPNNLPRFGTDELARLGAMSFPACAAHLSRFFVDEQFSDTDLRDVCAYAYDFPMPLTTMDGKILDAATPEPEDSYMLELFHGPTLAFKDFAARFMGRTVSHLLTRSGDSRTILVATSGDTGGAIGHAFLNLSGVRVFILYPNGGVSSVQEQQLTSMGKMGGGNSNIKAIAIEATFDDCQALVKKAFANNEMSKEHHLMSANSINVGRVIPQSFYYFWTSLQVKAAFPTRPIVYSIPSGNLGNLTGGLIARNMAAPIDKFVVGNNVNDPFVDYLNNGEYTPRPSISTLSNAMDIGRPNNLPRILSLFDGDYDRIKEVCSGYSYSDEQTERHLRKTYVHEKYLMCPHTAIGHMAMEEFAARTDKDYTKVTVSTAHPAKFMDEVKQIIREDIPLPGALQASIDAPSHKHVMAPSLSALDNYIRENE